jgi:hypothetical protein
VLGLNGALVVVVVQLGQLLTSFQQIVFQERFQPLALRPQLVTRFRLAANSLLQLLTLLFELLQEGSIVVRQAVGEFGTNFFLQAFDISRKGGNFSFEAWQDLTDVDAVGLFFGGSNLGLLFREFGLEGLQETRELVAIDCVASAVLFLRSIGAILFGLLGLAVDLSEFLINEFISLFGL